MPNQIITPSHIINNTPSLSPRQKEIAKNIYHFTDVNNAAKILNSGYVYSRNYAHTNGLMVNDNAAGSVIDGTNDSIHTYARFYFRPLTPTQYRNEGIRSQNEIHPTLQAHCPVPIFLLFNADKVIADPSIEFSYESLASYYHVPRYKFTENPKALLDAPLHHIYHVGYYPPEESIIKKRRHAELIAKNRYSLNHLEYIICRNEYDKITLCNLLTPEVFNEYKNMILIPKNLSDYYTNEYLSIKSISFNSKNLKIEWNQPNVDSDFHFRFEIYSLDRRNLLCKGEQQVYCPHQHNKENLMWVTNNHLKNYDVGLLEIYLDEHLVYKGTHHFID